MVQEELDDDYFTAVQGHLQELKFKNGVLLSAVLLFNESFAATNEREGSEIGRQNVNALLEKEIKSDGTDTNPVMNTSPESARP
ncbi:MAG: hypothetical protein ACK2T4_12580 [Candidatus Promineifilaceae bacterium]|jgi:hypothetical protein